METYFLITNVSGMKYWSYLGHRGNTFGIDYRAVERHGIIFINRNGGYFTPDCVRFIHDVCIQAEFPKEIS